MTSICPLCNGFTPLNSTCIRCGTKMMDGGRLGDYYDDYSPYREIDDLKMTNGYYDVSTHHCIHLIYCPNCHWDKHYWVDESWHP